MTPLSLIHIVNVDGLGGTGATAFRLARLLAERGHRVLFCVRPGSVWIDLAARTGLEISTELGLEAGFRPAGFLRDLRTLRRMVRERGAQIVHVHRSAEYWRAALVLGSRRDGSPGRPRLVRSRGVVTPIAPHAVNRWLHNSRTDMVVCTASAIRDMYRTLPGFDISKVELLLDGVDIQAFRPGLDGSAMRRALGIGPDAPVVGVVARLDAVKGHTHLIAAAPGIVKRFPDVRFILTGRLVREKLAQELRAQAQSRGVAEHFIFAGSLPYVPAVLAASDLFALSSVGSEGSSRGTLEAMACGLPVVASNLGCLPDIVLDGETGFLVPHSTPDAIVDRICRLLADRELRGRMGRAGRRRVEAQFNEQDVVSRLEHIYSRLVEASGR
jgi:glycosyltransferase involved in cell wall biosynthesis